MILHICCNLAGSTVFPQMFEALHDIGVEQCVFVPEKDKVNLGVNIPPHVITHERLTVKKTDALFFFRKAQRSLPVINSLVDLKQVHMIHAHTLFSDGSIANHLYKKTGTPYGVTVRYSDIEVIWKWEPHLHALGRMILANASFIVFLGRAYKERVLNTWVSEGLRVDIEKKSFIIPNGILPKWLDGTPKHMPAGSVHVGFAGRFIQRKRPLDSITAAHRAGSLSNYNVFWHGCGGGPLQERIRHCINPGDTLEGPYREIAKMKAFYRNVDVLLVPSIAETFGMVYLEAMSQGVPVLYTKGQGFDGQFPEGTIGSSVVCGDIEQQAKSILRIIGDEYEAISARCIYCAEQYAWPIVAAKWKSVYQKYIPQP